MKRSRAGERLPSGDDSRSDSRSRRRKKAKKRRRETDNFKSASLGSPIAPASADGGVQPSSEAVVRMIDPGADIALLKGALGRSTNSNPVENIEKFFEVQPQIVSSLMTPEHQKLLSEETGILVQWMPAESKVHLSGSAEQHQKAERLLQRVKVHCSWGHSVEKVRRLLKPRQVESIRCQLTPMGDKLPGLRRTLSASRAAISMGKGPNNDIIMPNPNHTVSRQHCVVEFDVDRGAVYILDCSTNGMFLNGVRLPAKKQSKVLLCHGDEIQFMNPRIPNEFGYMVNLTEIQVKEEHKLGGPRRAWERLDAPDGMSAF